MLNYECFIVLMALTVGDFIPDIPLRSSSGKDVSLKNLEGKKVILYFYPKDDTPGCTQEACDFRDHLQMAEALNTVILGVSKDPIHAHNTFIQKYGLPFELISDEEGKWLEMFDVWKEKSMYGKTYMGIERSTFLIDEKGKIVREWRKVSVPGHVAEVLEMAKSL